MADNASARVPGVSATRSQRLLDRQFTTEEMRTVFSDHGRLQGMLDFEVREADALHELPAFDCALISRMEPDWWTNDRLDWIERSGTPVLADGPLPAQVERRLGVVRSGEIERDGAQNVLATVAPPTASRNLDDYIDTTLIDELRAEGFIEAMAKKYGKR